jgi:membrane fusion protein (multidrug efflux system)
MTQANPDVKQGKKVQCMPWILGAGLILAIAAIGLYAARPGADQAKETTSAPPEKRIPVVVTHPEQRMFERTLVTQGNIEAKHVALVSPRIPGTLETIAVDEGDKVVAGQTKLFQTDAVKLQQAVLIAEHDLAVAHCAQRQAEANLEKVGADLHKGELDYKRFERLLAQEATTPDVFEQQESRYRQLQAAQKLAQAQVDLVTEQARQVQAALMIAQKDLSDTTVIAPINGVVSERFREPGEMGAPGKEVVRIEDPSLVEICVFLPATAYPEVVAGQTKMRVTVSGIDLGDQTIAYKSPTIDAMLRTFEVKCLIQNPPDGVAPGAMAQVAVVLDGRETWGVPVRAVQTRSGQSVVFVVEGQQARQKVVETGYTQDGWIALTKGDITDAHSVVTLGQYQLDDGVAVSIQQGDK